VKPVTYDSGVRWNDPNLRWGNPSYLLEPGDAGYLPGPAASPTKPRKKRKYMASNPTPDRLDELLAAGEDLCDGMNQHAAAIGLKQNTLALARAELDALLSTHFLFRAAEGAQPAASATLRTADSNAKGFIARAVKVLSISLGNDWSDEWLPTGLPDNSTGVPRTQDKRFAALNGLKAYFTANPGKENAALNVTAAIAATLHTALSDGRLAVANSLSNTKGKLIARDAALEVFRKRFRGTIGELEQLLADDDPKWYDFGLNRPSDPATPGVPGNVVATALGGGRVLVQIDGARRANSHSFYRQLPGDAEPVKATNTEGAQFTIEGLPAGQTVQITVTGVNDAGEGQPSDPVSVVVS
jgi:hypothetical protein